MRKVFDWLFIITLLFVGLVNTACKERLIPERDMAQILTKVFIADATIESRDYALIYFKKDSIEYYKPIYTELGYTEKQFNTTLEYYIGNPERLDKVLDRVVNKLARIETEVIASMSRVAKEGEIGKGLWEGRRSWRLPRDGKHETIEFKIPIIGEGEYTLKAEIKIMLTDGSLQPQMVAWFLNEDTIADTLIELQRDSVKLSRDGEFHEVSLTLSLYDTLATHIMGHVLHHQPKEGDWKKEAEVKQIALNYTPPIIPWYRRGISPRVRIEFQSEIKEFPKDEILFDGERARR